MVKLLHALRQIGPAKVMVIGDFLLDSYTMGKARRISPEAPVPVVHAYHQEYRPGGAGNVVLNLIDLGVEVVAVGRTGNDASGRLLREGLTHNAVHQEGLVVEEGYLTPLKNRLIADRQQIVRIDHEVVVDMGSDAEEEVLALLPRLLDGVGIVAISDYGKGMLTERMLQTVYALCREQEIVTITDPKGTNFTKYRGTTIIKPNESEAYAAAKQKKDTDLLHIAESLLKMTEATSVLVTRAEKGISLFTRDEGRQDFSVRMREVIDVTGAGDTVLAVITCALANRLSLEESAQLANLAAGMAIEEVGCARVRLSELARRLLEESTSCKIFSKEHHFFLQKALQEQPFVVIGIGDEEAFSVETFLAIHRIAQKHEKEDVVVYIEGNKIQEEWLKILSTLRDVQWILREKESWHNLCRECTPRTVYWVKKGKVQEVDHSCV